MVTRHRALVRKRASEYKYRRNLPRVLSHPSTPFFTARSQSPKPRSSICAQGRTFSLRVSPICSLLFDILIGATQVVFLKLMAVL
uniref:Uncharacterized protein n=1 Tax=Oryza punctata TaxID=4537 RepID=A0A0E0LUB9_ORYPU